MFIVRRSRRLRKNFLRYRKKRIDYSKYIKDFYLEGGLAYISCNVKEYYDIIDCYSVPDYEWLNAKFARFVEENAYYIPTEYPIVLEICGVRFSDAQQACIRETITDYYSLKLGDKQLALDANKSKSFLLIGMGVLLFFIVGALQTFRVFTSSTLMETFFILFWFFVWEFGDCALLDRMDLQQEKIQSAQLASIKVIFSEHFHDAPVDAKTQKALMESIYTEESAYAG